MMPKQIRAARALLGWTAQELAQKAKVGLGTIKRAEAGRPVTAANAAAIQQALENGGIEIGDNGGVWPKS